MEEISIPSHDSPDSEGSMRSTASGAAKRSRSRRRRTKRFRGRLAAEKHTSVEEEQGEEASALADEQVSEDRRKKSRPITTGKGVGIRARKEADAKFPETKEQIRRAQEIIKGGYEFNRRRAAEKSKLEGELKFLPVRDIAAELMKRAESIERMASTAGNLKGIFVKHLREAALYVKVATDALPASRETSPHSTGNKRERIGVCAKRSAVSGRR